MFPVNSRIHLIFSFNFDLPLFSKIRCEIIINGSIEFQVWKYSVRTRKYLIKMLMYHRHLPHSLSVVPLFACITVLCAYIYVFM